MPGQNIDDYTLKIKKLTPQDKKEIKDEVPVYESRLELSPDLQEKIVEDMFEELEEIKKEQEDNGLRAYWRAMQRQYDGETNDTRDKQFNLHRHTTRIKINAATSRETQAFLKSEPKYSVEPRPQYANEGGIEVCEKQQDFLDTKIDEEIPLRKPIILCNHSANLKGVGILKIDYEIERETRSREECYKGTPVKLYQPDPKNPQGKPIEVGEENKGLDEFLLRYPDAEEKYPGLVKKLKKGEQINLVADISVTTYDDPFPKYVSLENFYVRVATDGYKGLKTTRLIVERISYNWWDLKKLERKAKFFGIDRLMMQYEKDQDGKMKATEKKRKRYTTKKFNVLECTFYYMLKDSDEEETKCIFWIAEEERIMIGAQLYPYYGVASRYIPFFIKHKFEGFYQPGIAEDLTDNNIAEDAILNFVLEGAWIRNTITPITPEDSDVDKQFMENRWTHGMPLNAKKDQIDFLQKYMPNIDYNSLLNLIGFIQKDSEDASGISSLMTGRADPIDPSAPASKTIALLKESGINVEDYILNLLPAYNEIAYIFLSMYHQNTKEGRKYRVRRDRMMGKPTDADQAFGEITRAELITRTSIQSQAYAFNFSKLEEKREDVALYSLIRQEPMLANNPEAVYFLVKELIKGWSPKWKAIVTRIFPTIQDVQKKMQEVALGAVKMYMEAKVNEAKITGMQPEISADDLQPLMQMIIQNLSEIGTPPSEEVMKEREEQSKEQKMIESAVA